MLGLIKNFFIYLNTEGFVTLHKSLVRSYLEYTNSVWNPYRQGLIKDLEKIQIRATKLVLSIKKLNYKRKTYAVEITNTTLKYRQFIGDDKGIQKINK